MELRTLRGAAEREVLLELLDGWDVGDGWRGRDFFRRYVELDPTYADENVWVAADADGLVGCVQIFPRLLRLGAAAVPTGGIGSVFTHPDQRRRGVGEALLARALGAMRARGMELSLLFTARAPWYTRLGWQAWPCRRLILERGDSRPAAAPDFEVAAFDPARDLAAAQALHERYDADREGSVIRDDALWRASLRMAGNPGEEFLVAQRGGGLLAYARAVVLYGILTLTEYACAPGAEAALAELLVRLLAPREDDPLAGDACVSGDARLRALGDSAARGAALRSALESRGVKAQEFDAPRTLLRCLDPGALARRLDEPPTARAEALLARRLPPRRFGFWAADRF
jgi:GNAT superfamily N-acetyltransferase